MRGSYFVGVACQREEQRKSIGVAAVRVVAQVTVCWRGDDDLTPRRPSPMPDDIRALKRPRWRGDIHDGPGLTMSQAFNQVLAGFLRHGNHGNPRWLAEGAVEQTLAVVVNDDGGGAGVLKQPANYTKGRDPPSYKYNGTVVARSAKRSLLVDFSLEQRSLDHTDGRVDHAYGEIEVTVYSKAYGWEAATSGQEITAFGIQASLTDGANQRRAKVRRSQRRRCIHSSQSCCVGH